jgi:hypothetical protein
VSVQVIIGLHPASLGALRKIGKFRRLRIVEYTVSMAAEYFTSGPIRVVFVEKGRTISRGKCQFN